MVVGINFQWRSIVTSGQNVTNDRGLYVLGRAPAEHLIFLPDMPNFVSPPILAVDVATRIAVVEVVVILQMHRATKCDSVVITYKESWPATYAHRLTARTNHVRTAPPVVCISKVVADPAPQVVRFIGNRSWR